MLLLGARLWLAGLLRRVGPTPLVCLPISRAQWRQRNLAPAESQPRLLAASQVRPTCPCAEAGFLYRVLSTDTLDQIRRTLPGVCVGGGVTFICLALGCHPRFQQVRRGRGSQERCLGLLPFWGLCFLWIPVVLISLLLGFQLIPLLPPSRCWPVMVKGLKGGLSIT